MAKDLEEIEEHVANKHMARNAKWQERQERSRVTRSEIRDLQQRLDELSTKLNAEDRKPIEEETQFTHFDQLPISQRTLMGLERGNYKRLTPIQADALPLALTGHDILGAAKTGSGKTLSFVIPLLERLHVERWDAEAGIGALVLSPTRELALQIFKVLQLVGYKHQFSAALLTGGRDVNEEKKRLHLISIIVGTPGRVLHHLQDASTVSTDNLQLFIMDEADRLLDMGFRETLNGILQFLPASRQTLLFSATQTTDVQMLAQMSLKDPRYVAAHILQSSSGPTPSSLCQNFVVLELHRKLDALLMFLKRHPNDKVVVFVSTCNQVKYMYLAFSKILKKMRIPSMCLTSKMKQFRREEVFLTFCRCKSAVLFCTDVASRGLDFPMVHWVVQYDCPDSAQTYIHRAGRTARAGARGVSLLFLTPSEVPMLSYLHHKKVPLREVVIKPHLMNESKEIFVALVVQGLKYDAQKAFIAYLRSIVFSSNKLVFSLKELDVEKFAHSLGLLVVPNMSELQNIQRGAKNLPWDVVNFIARRDAEKADKQDPNRTRKERHLAASDMFRILQQKQKYATNAPGDDDGAGDDDDDDMSFLVKKPKNTAADGSAEQGAKPSAATDALTFDERMQGLSKAKKKKLLSTADIKIKDLGLSKRTVFAAADDEEDGNNGADETALRQRLVDSLRAEHQAAASSDDDNANEADYAAVLRRRLVEANAEDTARMKLLRRQRQLKREGRLNDSGAGKNDGGGGGVTLGGASGSDDDGSSGEEDDAFGGAVYDSDSDDDSIADLVQTAKHGRASAIEEDDSDEEEEEAPVARRSKRHRRE